MEIEVDVSKRYSDFLFHVKFKTDSKRIGILGSSGSGKSLTLKTIAGIIHSDSGIISISDKVIYDSNGNINLKTQKRKVGYLFQNYALFPNMTVAQNILCGVRLPKKERQELLQKMISQFCLERLENHYPHELSGGQQQRVALARIFASSPDVILLDEPFSALDSFLKEQLQRELFNYLETFDGIVIFVSHDRDEVYKFCDELLVIEKGKSVCFGKTKEIFHNPEYKSVAILTGCKNIAEIQRIDDYTVYLKEWNCTVRTVDRIPEGCKYAGYRAHDFIPLWNLDDQLENHNIIKVKEHRLFDLPFEREYYVNDAVTWKVQDNGCPQIDENGMPGYLQINIEKLMFLK